MEYLKIENPGSQNFRDKNFLQSRITALIISCIVPR
jgi:hypothetical protein